MTLLMRPFLLLKALEQPRTELRRNARPFIRHADLRAVADPLQRNANRSARGREFAGIRQKVGHDLAQSVAIHLGNHRFGRPF